MEKYEDRDRNIHFAHSYSMQIELGWAYVGYQLQKYICPLDQDQVAIDIAVTDFPDYVLRMTEEDEHSNSLLTKEYWVFDT